MQCRSCGETDESKFYSSRTSRKWKCKACLRKAWNEWAAKTGKRYESIRGYRARPAEDNHLLKTAPPVSVTYILGGEFYHSRCERRFMEISLNEYERNIRCWCGYCCESVWLRPEMLQRVRELVI